MPRTTIVGTTVNSLPVKFDRSKAITPLEFVAKYGAKRHGFSFDVSKYRCVLTCISQHNTMDKAVADDELAGLFQREGELITLPEDTLIAPLYAGQNIFAQWVMFLPKGLDDLKQNQGVASFMNSDGQYGVMDKDWNLIVPFGKYDWISDFNYGLARVRKGGILPTTFPTTIEGETISMKKTPERGNLWGIINSYGKVVLPIEYDDIWKFEGRGYLKTKAVKNGNEVLIDLTTLNPNLRRKGHISVKTSGYGKYAGSYAQDVAGLNDRTIDDAFEGDPDAYWNID